MFGAVHSVGLSLVGHLVPGAIDLSLLWMLVGLSIAAMPTPSLADALTPSNVMKRTQLGLGHNLPDMPLCARDRADGERWCELCSGRLGSMGRSPAPIEVA